MSLFEQEVWSHDRAVIERWCDEGGWDTRYAEKYYDKLRAQGHEPKAARMFTLNRARNYAEQRKRRLSHETGAT